MPKRRTGANTRNDRREAEINSKNDKAQLFPTFTCCSNHIQRATNRWLQQNCFLKENGTRNTQWNMKVFHKYIQTEIVSRKIIHTALGLCVSQTYSSRNTCFVYYIVSQMQCRVFYLLNNIMFHQEASVETIKMKSDKEKCERTIVTVWYLHELYHIKLKLKRAHDTDIS